MSRMSGSEVSQDNHSPQSPQELDAIETAVSPSRTAHSVIEEKTSPRSPQSPHLLTQSHHPSVQSTQHAIQSKHPLLQPPPSPHSVAPLSPNSSSMITSPVNPYFQWPPSPSQGFAPSGTMFANTGRPISTEDPNLYLPNHNHLPPGYSSPPSQPPSANLQDFSSPGVISASPTLGYGPTVLEEWGASAVATEVDAALKYNNRIQLIRTLAQHDPLRVGAIRAAYHQQFKRSLVEDIKNKKMDKVHEMVAVALARGPLLNDVHAIRDAVKGIGTNERVLTEVLLGRSNADMTALQRQYFDVFVGRELISDVKSDLSGDTKLHFGMVVAGIRADESVPVMAADLERDLAVIPDVINNKKTRFWKKNEKLNARQELREILTKRNSNHIRAMADIYQKRYQASLEDLIKKEFTGHLEDALLFQLREANDKYMHAATMLEKSLEGIAVNEEMLIRRLVRHHWDRNELANVKGAYEIKYNRTLETRIGDKASEVFKQALLSLLDLST